MIIIAGWLILIAETLKFISDYTRGHIIYREIPAILTVIVAIIIWLLLPGYKSFFTEKKHNHTPM